jgi:NADPH:quinone reductase-like Zn-dependent oxidoreductase
MKAFVLRAYGSPDRLDLMDVGKPVPGPGEVLVRVRATSVNPYDWHGMRGEPLVARLMPGLLGLRGPAVRVLGCDMAGRVEATGRDATRFRPGDDVFALLAGGGFGEYVTVREDLLTRKPHNLSYEQTAAVPMAGVTALLALRDQGRLQGGQSVLITGASGGVGTFAVQIAKAFGAKVAAVCSAGNADLVRSIGADEVIDYRSEDFTRGGPRFDLMLDIAGSRPVLQSRRALTPKGTFVVIGGQAGRWVQPAGHALGTLAMGPFLSQRMLLADAVGCTAKRQALMTLTDLIEEGSVTPVIDRRYSFEDLPAAVRYQEEGHTPGKVVVTVSAGIDDGR